jgi:hypothetical protein
MVESPYRIVMFSGLLVKHGPAGKVPGRFDLRVKAGYNHAALDDGESQAWYVTPLMGVFHTMYEVTWREPSN